MYATFKMDLQEFNLNESMKAYYEIGTKYFEEQKRSVQNSLDTYLSASGVLRASDLENDWFPQVQADVFLSHSHKDEKSVIALAGLLSEFGIHAFIDSCIWGYVNDLLKNIDDEYCIQSLKPNGGCIYDYNNRNDSTAHVHAILNGALAKMIDATECLIFLDTPNSLKVSDLKDGITDSCWIYAELLYTRILRKKVPIRKSLANRSHAIFENNTLQVEYNVDFSNLINLTFAELVTILSHAEANHISGKSVLDLLYSNKGVLR